MRKERKKVQTQWKLTWPYLLKSRAQYKLPLS